MIRRPPRSTQSRSSAASDVYKRQVVRACSVYPRHGLLVVGAKDGVGLTPAFAPLARQVYPHFGYLATVFLCSCRNSLCLSVFSVYHFVCLRFMAFGEKKEEGRVGGLPHPKGTRPAREYPCTSLSPDWRNYCTPHFDSTT